MADHEAGWGFVAEKEALLMYASVLPCTVALEFDDSTPDGAVLRSRHCYEDAAAKIEAYTGAQRMSTLCPAAFPRIVAFHALPHCASLWQLHRAFSSVLQS